MMKRLLFFLFLISFNAFAQKSEIFRIDSLPAEGVLLNKGWKFHAGDNLNFARADFDDSTWENIDPTKDIFDLPQLPKTGEIFWLRLHFEIDSTLDKQLVMLLQQSGATEIYLQGKLIHRFGVLSQDIKKISAYTPQEQPNSFPIQKSVPQLLAVRYAFQPHILYGTHFATTNKCFAIVLDTPENWFEKHKFKENGSDLDIIAGSFYLVLAILFFALYLYYPNQKTNLYFVIYTFLMSLPYLLSSIIKYFNTVGSNYWKNNILLICSVVSLLFLLKAIYQLFDKKTPFTFWLIALFGIACIPLSLFVYNWGWVVFGIGYYFTIYLEIIRISIGGVINKKKGAWIIALGGILVFIFWFLFIFSANTSGYFTSYLPYFYAVAQICLPVSVALFLGYKFAQTNISLQQKLIEIENLSFEKHNILASQNETLEKQVIERTFELNQSLSNLKTTQAQLIQSEKLASLGELTAGIAHEIQNPLNFVNNFSEVSKELMGEMKDELAIGNLQLANEIASDIEQNLEKIHHHGKRADAIVKGMLEHSKTGSGQNQETDINGLADEFLRLTYQSFLAREKDFHAEVATNFDTTLPKVSIIPQDIGKVFLNLYNNAFYAVNERRKDSEAFNPQVTVATKMLANKIQISVKDNGSGISKNISDKIFQPFFTTKPTGQGTGLGLSLAYDILTKGHGGTLEVNSTEESGSEFIITLPFKSNV